MTRPEAEQRLQKTFRLSRFYDDQWDTIQKILQGKRVLLIEKTGFGKSLCFQFPATVFDGTTVIFSPLIALMRDQVKKLVSLGIPTRCINSEQTPEENTAIMEEAKQGNIKILYIAPERQENQEWIEAALQIKLSMVVVDEAHCISVWGHDFRPAFRKIIRLVKLLPAGLPVLATTATATARVEKDIEAQIGDGITVIRGMLMRDNFKLSVLKVNSEDEKLVWLGQYIAQLPGNGIIYTGTKPETEVYAKWLEYLGINCMGYNGGLDAASRIEIENGLMANKWKCVISTNALGMGIDKPDIRFIIHTQMPLSPIHYYQEIGRAGRDGLPAEIILLYEPEDRALPEAFIESARPSVAKYKKFTDALTQQPLGEQNIMRATNLKQGQVRTIKADLIEQGIVREVMYGTSKKFELVAGAPPLNTTAFEQQRAAKTRELENMIEYVNTRGSRMKFLCDYLGDDSGQSFNNCDNTGLPKLSVVINPAWALQLEQFREQYFPVLGVGGSASPLTDGVAASHYGVSTVGTAIHRSKYENGGDYPDFLLKLVLKAFRKKFGQEVFDLVLYVPPTSSGGLVKNFAEKFAKTLKFPLSHSLIKTRPTNKQKEFENTLLKKENVKNAFTYATPAELKGKSILLVDDIFDSGATIKEIGRILTKFGAVKIAPIVIARTVGGDMV